MIKLHRLNGQDIILNAELIEAIEAIPDTSIILYTGNRFIVKESPDEVRDLVLDYKSSISKSIPKTKK
ncbi:MAG: flagellar FlbD family protein [Endomicrobiales bacterium]|nr:flagellar FlbD family protein [Endomicrobiales bacterium]